MSASETLAATIVALLIKEKLLRADDAERVAPKLSAGQMRSDDWRLPIEKAGEKKDVADE